MNDITYVKLKCLQLKDFEDISLPNELPYKSKFRFKLKTEMVYLVLYTYIYTTHLDVLYVRQASLEKHRSFSSLKEFLIFLENFLNFKPDSQYERRVFIEENLREYIDS